MAEAAGGEQIGQLTMRRLPDLFGVGAGRGPQPQHQFGGGGLFDLEQRDPGQPVQSGGGVPGRDRALGVASVVLARMLFSWLRPAVLPRALPRLLANRGR